MGLLSCLVVQENRKARVVVFFCQKLKEWGEMNLVHSVKIDALK